MQEFQKVFGEAFGFVVEAGADVMGFGLKDEGAVVVEDAAAEIEAHALGGRGPEFDRQEIIVARRRFEAEPAFDDRKDEALLLQIAERRANIVEKRSPSLFEDVQIPRVIDVISDGALGIGDAVLMAENGVSHERLSQ